MYAHPPSEKDLLHKPAPVTLTGLKLLLFSITLAAMPVVHSSDTIILPEPRMDSAVSVEQAIQNRRSVREFSDRPLTLAEASQLLWSAQGLTDSGGLRSAPSAGALYPLVVYLVAGNVTGLKAGTYQYSPDGHKLRLIKDGDSRVELATAAYRQHWLKDSAALLIFSAIAKKTTWKYGQRGIRYIHIEVGHSAQNVFLQAQSLGIEAAVVGAMDGERIKAILKLSTEEEVLYLMPVGRSRTE
jgi:SagB-type dehydrogenase family enzyme